MKYRVTISETAQAELDEAYLWFAVETPQHAPEWHGRMVDAILSLEEYPLRCAAFDDFRHRGQELRQLLVGNRARAYRVLFVIQGAEVHILHIVDAARGNTD